MTLSGKVQMVPSARGASSNETPSGASQSLKVRTLYQRAFEAFASVPTTQRTL